MPLHLGWHLPRADVVAGYGFFAPTGRYEAGATDNVGLRAAYNVPAIGGAFGLGYYVQQKLSEDSGSALPAVALRALNLYGKNHLVGIGPDVTMAVFKSGGTIGLLNVRYFWESAGRSSFQGSTFVVGLTIARPRAN